MPAGLGGLDEEGVYFYGESDIESFASDLLNRLSESVRDQLILDRIRLGALEAVPAYVADDAALPSTGNWLGRMLTASDTGIAHRWNGSAWKPWGSDWVQYSTAAPTNVTLGTGGTCSLSYRYEQGRIHVRGRIKLGSSGIAVGTDPKIPLPLTGSRALVHSYEAFFGRSYGYDTSGINNFTLNVVADNASTTTALIQGLGTNGAAATVTASAPFAWAVNDGMDLDFWVEVA